ncbi:S1 RNA-binding domain-containing protein [Synechococcus sp. CS-205]|jgi:small subunit ribosomal protein S1|uniref:S1 RNA-binding domain-containing protein n=1 Tax=Synechococcus sp. CS-205 TaxID=2847984 RepID=UPI00223BF5A3|nr:S1 RNA-binding domain-containing protein [Synechococcus sp. CS-205]MCT0247551.1 S1 RNA-binding domain-containing protein [Synechococcus sp. CS-205]
MAGSQRPVPPSAPRPNPQAPARVEPPLRKPPQLMYISRKEEEDEEQNPPAASSAQAGVDAPAPAVSPEASRPVSPPEAAGARAGDDDRFETASLEGMTMADLLGAADGPPRRGRSSRSATSESGASRPARTVDDFDFDEDAFLAALDENEPVGATGDVVTGTVISVESDGVYVDIGGKAPGFMPKAEAGLGVISNIKERFPKGQPVEVLVTREQNADGMVTISARALALRQSWEKVKQLEADGKVVQVKVSGFNRGGVTCDLEGLRGFIPRSQLQNGENHEELVGTSFAVAFLEVNAETRKLVLSEKRAASASLLAELEVGQLVDGQVVSVKPYGFFVDLGGVSGLLHQSSITGTHLRDIRTVFSQGERLKALVTQIDPSRGRIALNTALLESQPGELLTAKETVMAEAEDRANRARTVLRQQEQDAG